MTITITITRLTLPDGLGETMRLLVPFVEPVALAIAGACGAGIPLQLGLDVGFRLARRALVG
ncbi:hypothetical protein [Actinomadura sp. HBU206391]|uniref:hypothetical protein n=1 Tax=Actinomadura sp. HBU206391 TaxID=2731692 RepID=UPI00164F487F|nr:hypothetical protein [Actinomadura sp. HBU206391]MBC6461656.1 hypothetical protein [Actinomadura sp. HBU206391]